MKKKRQKINHAKSLIVFLHNADSVTIGRGDPVAWKKNNKNKLNC